MDTKLAQEVAVRLEKGESVAIIRQAMLDAGFGEPAIEEALKGQMEGHIAKQHSADSRNSKLLSLQETITRIGYGAVPPQFINILFSFTGASLFLIGLFNGLRSVISMVLTSVLQEYSKVHRVSKNVISGAGIIFGFSFFLMGFALRSQAVWLYATGILLAGVGVVVYGDLYHKFVAEVIRQEKKGALLAKMGYYGVLITMIAMLLSGYIIEAYPDGSNILGYPIAGYLLSFEITAFAFIISGYLLTYLKEQREKRIYPLGKFIGEHARDLRVQMSIMLKNKYTLLMLLATAIAGILEVLGHSYYGLYIYRSFDGGFIVVAILYSLAILTSFLGPWFTRKLHKAIGLSPMLVFGTLLTAILPLTLVFNVNILSVGAALIFSVMGASIIGVSQGMLARKLMDEKTRKKYFMSIGMILALPYLILVPLGAWFAQHYGFDAIFLAIGIGLAVIVAPIYFILVAMASKERL